MKRERNGVLFSFSTARCKKNSHSGAKNWDDFLVCERSNRCQIRLARVVNDQDDVIEPSVPHHIKTPFRFDGVAFKGKSLHPLEVGRRFRQINADIRSHAVPPPLPSKRSRPSFMVSIFV